MIAIGSLLVAAELGPETLPLQADARSSESLEAAFAEVVERLGTPTALVHAVGSTLLRPAHAINDQEFADVIATNLTSAFFALRAFVRAAPRERQSAALFFSSAATSIGLVNHDAISAAKGGIDGLVTAAAATYASRNIRVNALAPGLVRSKLTRRLVENPKDAAGFGVDASAGSGRRAGRRGRPGCLPRQPRGQLD